MRAFGSKSQQHLAVELLPLRYLVLAGSTPRLDLELRIKPRRLSAAQQASNECAACKRAQ
jgi:hypothetical protein